MTAKLRVSFHHALVVALALVAAGAAAADDPWLWLEDIDGAKPLEWVAAQNEITTSELTRVPEYQKVYDRAVEILDSDDRIAFPSIRGSAVFNFWQDAEHPRGVWRRTTLDSYRTEHPNWKVLVDIDSMAEAEGIPWVYKGVDCLGPENRRCLVQLSEGGGDAISLREYDLVNEAWVADGFATPTAKTFAAWKDENTLWIATDFGAGSLTASGYPRLIKEWRRGTPLADARTVLEAPSGDVLAAPSSTDTPEGRYHVFYRMLTMTDTEKYLVFGGRVVRLDLPVDCSLAGIFRDRLLITPRSELELGGRVFPAASLLAVPIDQMLRGQPAPEVLFTPTPTVFLEDVQVSRDNVVVTTLDNVLCRLVQYALEEGGVWTTEEIPLPGHGTVGVAASELEGSYVFNYQDFVTPPSLFMVRDSQLEKLKAQPAMFDSGGITVTQRHAVSADGTRVPYFLVTPKGFKADGTTPTVVTGYGGFEISMLPEYDAVLGAAWLEPGGAYALANLRGGGEFGPEWHRAAQREKRIKWIEDFIAIADDLVEAKITSRQHLGIEGGSNSGLLVGAAFTLRPDLCGAVVCGVPLLDMSRYHKMLAGASWMSEYGNPDVPGDWEFMKTWSPYHLLRKDADYPEVFLWANHRDDRVHPGHARKMAAKMLSMGHPVTYYEHLEGGHGIGSVSSQRAEMTALQFAFLWRELR